MKLITVKQLMKKSKTALIRKITKSLRSMPKKKLAMLCYEMTKSKLPRLRTTKQKALPKRKTKRKFSKKQLAAQRLFAKRARAGTLRRRKR
jgi:predicted transcriptional regulator YheO